MSVFCSPALVLTWSIEWDDFVLTPSFFPFSAASVATCQHGSLKGLPRSFRFPRTDAYDEPPLVISCFGGASEAVRTRYDYT